MLSNLNRLLVFHTAAELQSFTRASEKLNLTQPGISKHIRALEERCGVKLFDRLGKRIVLTQAGEILYETTKSIFSLIQEAEGRIDDLRGSKGGRLTIGSSITIGTHLLPGVLAEFRKAFPLVSVTVEMAPSEVIEKMVLSNAIDVGLVGHLATDPRLQSRLFLKDELAVIVSSGHEWASRESITPGELADQPFILAKEGSGTRRIVEERLRKAGVSLRRVMEFGNTEGLKKAVEAGLGVSIASKYVIEQEAARGSICTLDLPGVGLERGLYVIQRREKHLTRAACELIELLMRNLEGS